MYTDEELKDQAIEFVSAFEGVDGAECSAGAVTGWDAYSTDVCATVFVEVNTGLWSYRVAVDPMTGEVMDYRRS